MATTDSASVNESTATIRHIDPRLVRVLLRAADLAAERGHWLGREHVLATLASETDSGASLFARWWPQEGAPDPLNGYPNDPAARTAALTLPELEAIAQQMVPPAKPLPVAAPKVEYTVQSPDADAYREWIAPAAQKWERRRYA